ncbi:hypothetical protein ACN47E_004476 [Coniothyrium glycines]
MPDPDTHHGLTCWLLDTRSLWPGTKITDSESARQALALISSEEQASVTRKYHIADARMSLASALLKRLFIHRTLATPWDQIKLGRKRDPKHGKPCALSHLPSSDPAPVEFNISHQAGLVALVGAYTPNLDVELGVDIVCVNERNDHRVISADGFDSWVDMYSELFSTSELFSMKYTLPPFHLPSGDVVHPEQLGRHDRCVVPGQRISIALPDGRTSTFDSEVIIEAKLRRFYTFWCYKEAYIKLDGEALLAKWIPRLEFENVKAPAPGSPPRCSTHGVWGERVSDAEVWFTGGEKDEERPHGVGSLPEGEKKRLGDTKLQIQAFEENFMIGVAAKMRSGEDRALPDVLTAFRSLDLEEDVLRVARGA